MNWDRRNFLLGSPLAAFGLAHLEEQAFAQEAGAKAPPDVVDFWVRDMGVPAHLILGAETTRGRLPGSPANTDPARQPLFLYYDPQEKTFLPADQIPPSKLASSPDAKLDFQLLRMRLNSSEHRQFESYTSGGLYLDFQQSQPQSIAGEPIALATSTFSAIFPPQKPAAANPARSVAGMGAGDSGKTRSRDSGEGSSVPLVTAPAVGNSIPLQTARQAQSLGLAGGLGKTSFACFAKDPRKTLFGAYVDVMSKLGNSAPGSYLPLLSLPLVGTGALNDIKGLVGSLHGQGGLQQWILVSAPVDIAATAGAAQSSPGALRLRTGSYLAIPKEHAAAIQDQLPKLKILNGHLVPKDATPLDILEAAPQAAPSVSYFSFQVTVTPRG